jgi:signal transduction histidine kinase/ligand-binding sensor domain-containing protein
MRHWFLLMSRGIWSGSVLITRCVFVLCLLCLGWSRMLAQSPGELSEFTHRSWRIQDGLPDQVIQALAQTPDRYLWLGTSKGLLRFDGQKFVEFEGPGQATLRAHGVFCLLVSRDGSLWIGTEGGGLLRYRQGQIRTYSVADGLAYPIVRTLFEDANGAIWAGTDFGVFRMSGDRFLRVEDPGKLVNLGAHSIIGDRDGSVWVGGSRLIRYRGDGYREYSMPRQSGSLRIKSLCETNDGTIWAGTVDGLYSADNHERFHRVQEVLGNIRFLQKDSGGRLWVGTIGNGLYVRDGQGFRHAMATSILPSNTVLSLLEDREGNMWVGTQSGLLRLSHTDMQMIPFPNATDSDFGTVMRDRDGTIWVSSSHLFRLRQGALEPYSFPGLSNVTVRSMLRERDGTLWIGTMGRGAYRIDPNGKMTRWQIGNNYVRGFLQARDSSVWIATDGGVSRWKDGRLDNYHFIEGALRINITAMASDPSGDLWIGTPHGLSLFHEDHFTQDDLTRALSDQSVWALHEGVDGVVWIGTDSGLYRWKNHALRRISLGNLLNSPAVYSILEDGSGWMWIGGPTAVIKVRRDNLERAEDRGGELLQGTQVFAVSTDLQGAELHGGMMPEGVLDADGSAWFPATQGVLQIGSMVGTKSPELPPMRIEAVQVDGRPVAFSSGIDLPAGSRTLQITYAPILLSSQSGLRFSRRLQGFDSDFSAPTAERTSFYTNLVPGHYEYEVRAFFANDPSQQTSAMLSLTQSPHLYQTKTFWLFCLFVLGLLAWLADRIRLHQVHERFAAVLIERSRLAREIHDTVIQGCTAISVLLEAYSSMPEPHSEAQRGILNVARQQAQETIEDARDAVWDLRHTDQDATGLGQALRVDVEQLVRDRKVRLQFSVVGDERPVDPGIARESMMTTREAVRNALLHAQASSIQVGLRYLANGFCIDVSDDGCGFSVAAAEVQDGRHFGLVGMRERVEQAGGSFTLQSGDGAGTRLSFSFPARKVKLNARNERSTERRRTV